MDPHCEDCGSRIPVPLTRDNGDTTSSAERALHAEHRTRCDKCAHAERLRVVKRLGNIDSLKLRAMRHLARAEADRINGGDHAPDA